MTTFGSLLFGPARRRTLPDARLDPPSTWEREPDECRECRTPVDEAHRCTLRVRCEGCDWCCPDRIWCHGCGNRASEGCLCAEAGLLKEGASE